MKFLFASDSFKGTLSSPKTAELLTQAAREIFPDCVCDSIEVADGGEGTTEAVLSAVKGTTIPLKVHGPLWEELYLGAARRLFRMLCAGRKLSVAVNGVNSNDSHKRAE